MLRKSLALLVLVFALAGCSLPVKSGGNTVRPLDLTEREETLTSLIATEKTDVLLFEYDVSEPCTQFEAWVEIYEKGELVAKWPAGLHLSVTEPQPWKGTLAITADHTNGIVWSFTAEDGAGGRYAMKSSEPFPVPETVGRSWGKIEGDLSIEIGEETVLYSSIFSDGTIRAYSEQDYLTNPEYIKEQDHLHLIKCRFSNDE